MQGELKYVKGAPCGIGNRVVGVYSFDEERRPEILYVEGKIVYGLRVEYRDEAPEWMRPYITMLDLTEESSDPTSYAPVVPGLGYKGSSWYVIVADKKYAEEAGLDVSSILNT